MRGILLKDACWDDESILNLETECDTSEGKVGYFEFEGTKIRTYGVPLDEGIAVENSLVMKVSYLPGVVSFDLESGMFEIRYTRILNIKERQKGQIEIRRCRYVYSRNTEQ